MREFMYDRISKDAAVVALVGDRVWSPGSVGRFSGSEVVKPFVVIRAGLAIRPMRSRADVYQQPFAIWVHDEPGTMELIDGIVAAVNSRLDSAAPAAWGASHVMECLHEGDSDDLYDDGFATNTRFSTRRLTFRK